MTPFCMGRTTSMVSGVRPSMSYAALPTALGRPSFVDSATTEGSFSTTPFPLTNTSTLAVPRSIPIERAKAIISPHDNRRGGYDVSSQPASALYYNALRVLPQPSLHPLVLCSPKSARRDGGPPRRRLRQSLPSARRRRPVSSLC